MSSSSARTTSYHSGFTVVELIIVITVIGILATIVYVGYSNATQSSKTSQNSSNAAVVAKKIEAYESINNTYPTDTTYANYIQDLDATPDTSLNSTGITLGPVDSSDTTNIAVSQCTAPSPYADGMAYRLQYWDYGKNQVSTTVLSNSLDTSTPCDPSGWTPLN